MAFNFIKKIWSNEVDEDVHKQFTRFSRGVFDNRAIMNLSRDGKVKVSSTFEYANDLVLFAASLEKRVLVSGILFSRDNPEGLLSSLGIKAEVRKKKNIFQAEINAQLEYEQLNKIAEYAYLMLFDCSAEGIELKIKKKLPKPSKSGKEKSDDKFCVLEADSKFFLQIKEEFAFGAGDFKKARIVHRFDIKEVIVPKDEKDFEQMRLRAKKKGKIIRQITADGKTLQEERDFEV